MGKKRKRGGGRHPEFGFFGDLLDAPPVATLDLHGDTAMEAERRVKDFILTQVITTRDIQQRISRAHSSMLNLANHIDIHRRTRQCMRLCDPG